MCPNCGNLWSLGIYNNGDWLITNEFSQPCWENGYNVMNKENKAKIGNIPWFGEEIPEKLSTVEDVEILIKFVESYKHN